MGLTMTDLASATMATAGIATATAATTLLPGIDGDALIGALAGGALFVTSARDLSLPSRAAYLLISVSVGYLAAPEVMTFLSLKGTGVAGFLAGACAVTVATQAIERIKSLDFSSIFPKRGA
jgi:Putative phage holin